MSAPSLGVRPVPGRLEIAIWKAVRQRAMAAIPQVLELIQPVDVRPICVRKNTTDGFLVRLARTTIDRGGVGRTVRHEREGRLCGHGLHRRRSLELRRGA